MAFFYKCGTVACRNLTFWLAQCRSITTSQIVTESVKHKKNCCNEYQFFL